MIKNKKQLTVTTKQLALLEQALEALGRGGEKDVATALRRRALQADVSKLKREIADYEMAQEGSVDFAVLAELDSLGRLLVQGRIAANLTQDDLAHELGRKPQQIQRYERSEYSSASLATLARVAHVIRSASSGGV
jgi:HTH-type transcriptional regulator / antitoxin HigA